MVKFKVLSGKTAGVESTARRFPFRIGRSSAADLQLEGEGVWDQHLELAFQPTAGFVLNVHPQAVAAINGETIRQAIMRNGDIIEIGALKLRFWLGDTRQSSLRLREWLTWAAFGLLLAGQLALIYWVLP